MIQMDKPFVQKYHPVNQGCCKVSFYSPAASKKREKGFLGTPQTPAKGCRPLHSCCSRFIPDFATALPPPQGLLQSLFLLACGEQKERKGFSGDTPDPGKGLPPSALLLFSFYSRLCNSPAPTPRDYDTMFVRWKRKKIWKIFFLFHLTNIVLKMTHMVQSTVVSSGWTRS